MQLNRIYLLNLPKMNIWSICFLWGIWKLAINLFLFLNAQKYKNWTQWLVGGKMEVSTITYQFEFTLNFCNFLHTKCTCFAPQFAYFILANTFVQILCAQISELTTPKLWKLFNFHEFRKSTKIFLIIWLVEIKKWSSFETNRIW